MTFYEVELLSYPKILFACSVKIEKHKNRFNCIENFIEMCVIESGRILSRTPDGKEKIIYPGTYKSTLCDANITTEAVQNEIQCHTTVGVDVEYKYTKYENEDKCDVASLKERMKRGNIFLLPYEVREEKLYSKILGQIKKIAALHSSTNPANGIAAIGEWFRLSAVMSDFCLEKLAGHNNCFTPSEYQYAHKASKYIENSFANKISVADVANNLEISEAHLHRIFKKVFGTGIIDYTNRYRIKVAIYLMENRGITLKDAALNVGIDDPAYMSRLFKKVTGKSFSDYMKK